MLGLYLILRNIPMLRGQTPAPLNKFKAPPLPRVRGYPRRIELAHTQFSPIYRAPGGSIRRGQTNNFGLNAPMEASWRARRGA